MFRWLNRLAVAGASRLPGGGSLLKNDLLLQKGDDLMARRRHVQEINDRGETMAKTMHNFEQVKDVLDYGIDLHTQLRGLYDRLGQQSEQARVKMLLDYLSRHERNRQAAMQRFEEGARASVLNVWLQYSPSSDIEQLLTNYATTPILTVEDALNVGMAFDNALIALYREAAEEIDTPEAKEVFHNLAEMEEREKQRFVRDAEWAQDF